MILKKKIHKDVISVGLELNWYLISLNLIHNSIQYIGENTDKSNLRQSQYRAENVTSRIPCRRSSYRVFKPQSSTRPLRYLCERNLQPVSSKEGLQCEYVRKVFKRQQATVRSLCYSLLLFLLHLGHSYVVRTESEANIR